MCGKCLDWTKGGIWRIFCCCCLCPCLSLSCLLITVLKMFRLDQKQLFTDYWRNLKPKQTFDPVPHYYPPSQWRPISGNGDKENRETLTSLCFHPVNSRLTFKNYRECIVHKYHLKYHCMIYLSISEPVTSEMLLGDLILEKEKKINVMDIIVCWYFLCWLPSHVYILTT